MSIAQKKQPTYSELARRRREITRPVRLARLETNLVFVENEWVNLRSREWSHSCCDDPCGVCCVNYSADTSIYRILHMSGPLCFFNGQLVSNMLCSDKAAKQTVRFHLQPVCVRVCARVCVSECVHAHWSASKPRSLIVRAKSQGNHNRSQGLLGGGESNVAVFKETHRFIVLDTEEIHEVNKGCEQLAREAVNCYYSCCEERGKLAL